jgi:hypothetical protein
MLRTGRMERQLRDNLLILCFIAAMMAFSLSAAVADTAAAYQLSVVS